MATNTEHLGLIKPEQTDFYNIEDFNANSDKIDEAVHNRVSKVNAILPQTTAVLDTLNTAEYAGNWGWLSPANNPFNFPEGALCVVTNDVIQYDVYYGIVQTIKPVYPTPNCDEIYTRAYYYGNEHSGGTVWTDWKKIALADEFLPLKGGTLSGSLTVSKDWANIVIEDSTGRKLLLEKNPENNYISLYSYANANNHIGISIRPEMTDVNDCFYLRRVINGTANMFKIYGEHNLPNPAKVQIGSYTGTGTYGSTNRCRLTFDFNPKIVIIQCYHDSGSYDYNATLVYGVNYAMSHRMHIGSSGTTRNEGQLFVTWGDKSVEWYNASSYYDQLNTSTHIYNYIAIG